MYYTLQLEYYYSCTILAIILSFLQHQLTSIFILLEAYIQSTQYYYSCKLLTYYIAIVLLLSCYASYSIQFFIVPVNKYINNFRSMCLEQLVLLILQNYIIFYKQSPMILILIYLILLAFLVLVNQYICTIRDIYLDQLVISSILVHLLCYVAKILLFL